MSFDILDANNPNNILAASWPLHQMLDGLDHYENMPVIKLSISSVTDETIATQDNRYSVTLQLEFFNEVDAAAFQARDGARQVDKRTWQTTVYVKNKDEFAAFVDWKGSDTQRQWDDYNAVLRDL
mmetsp:Transcript_9267/g.17729  ORF Transcript_9267/g.17729 Transcript_9267/m.17729 type:complete len:125 (-) Transcript_9267:92-466(-)|eukprot:scaffold46454_cov298-Amphora_coffeaeformis.AAC.1